MQEVIVYRNPAEAAFWNALSNNGDVLLPIIAGLLVFVTVFIWLNHLLTRGGRFYMQQTWRTYVPMAVGGVAGVLVFRMLQL